MNEAMSFLYIQLYLTNQVSFQFKIKNKKKKKTSIVFPSFLDGKMKGQPDLCAFNKKIRQECVLGDLKVSVLQLVDMRVGLFKQSFFFAWQILKGELIAIELCHRTHASLVMSLLYFVSRLAKYSLLQGSSQNWIPLFQNIKFFIKSFN